MAGVNYMIYYCTKYAMCDGLAATKMKNKYLEILVEGE